MLNEDGHGGGQTSKVPVVGFRTGNQVTDFVGAEPRRQSAMLSIRTKKKRNAATVAA